MSDIRLTFDSAGFRALLLSDGVRDLVADTSNTIAQRANANAGGDGYEASVEVGGYGGGRWLGFVHSTTAAAVKAEAEDKALTRAVTQ